MRRQAASLTYLNLLYFLNLCHRAAPSAVALLFVCGVNELSSKIWCFGQEPEVLF